MSATDLSRVIFRIFVLGLLLSWGFFCLEASFVLGLRVVTNTQALGFRRLRCRGDRLCV